MALEKILKNHRGNLLDIQMKLPAEDHSVRLLAIPASVGRSKSSSAPGKRAENLAKALNRTSSPQHLKALVLAGTISMSMSLTIGIRLARSYPDRRYRMEKIFDHVIGRFAGLGKLAEIALLLPVPRHLQARKIACNSLCQRIMELPS